MPIRKSKKLHGEEAILTKHIVSVYPGSFDPVTNGHLDVIGRSASLFEKVIVAVLINLDKKPLFTLEERVEMLKAVTDAWKNVEIVTFDGLLVDFATKHGAKVIVRGIRAISDYEYEFQMAMMNRRLQPALETVFMIPAESYSYVSSRLVKEVCELGGSVKGLVPELVEQKLKQKQNPVAGSL